MMDLDIIIGGMLIFMGIYFIVKKDGGLKDSAKVYTEESLAKYSIISGIIFAIGGALEIFIVYLRQGIPGIDITINIENEILDTLFSMSPGIVALVVAVILWFSIIKKKEDK